MVRPIPKLLPAATAAALIAFTPMVLIGQEMRPLEPGTRVRVTAPGLAKGVLIGNVAYHNPDTLSVFPESADFPFAVPTALLQRLEISRGRTIRPGAVRKGALAGALIVGAVGAGFAYWKESSTFGSRPRGEIVGMFGLGGGLAGGGVGALIGTTFKSDLERWEDLPFVRNGR